MFNMFFSGYVSVRDFFNDKLNVIFLQDSDNTRPAATLSLQETRILPTGKIKVDLLKHFELYYQCNSYLILISTKSFRQKKMKMVHYSPLINFLLFVCQKDFRNLGCRLDSLFVRICDRIFIACDLSHSNGNEIEGQRNRLLR